MPNTYTQIYLQLIFAVRYREAQIKPEWKQQFQQYTTGIIQENKHKLIQINSLLDHVHIFLCLNPNQSLSDLVQSVKTETSKWIKTVQTPTEKPFFWQHGFGAFSHGHREFDDVIRFVQNQGKTHEQQSFLEEYQMLLKAYKIPFEQAYIFKELE
ncbi:MAG: IS200/IS605 family transposase [Chitinophagaceae bacterium]